MEILSKAFGAYSTNCYIVNLGGKQAVIDPGDGAFGWVMQNAKNLKAIICTHGHFDHIYDVCEIKKASLAPIFIHRDDAFMLENDIFNEGYHVCKPDFAVDEGAYECEGFSFEFMHFTGHTPGCSMVRFEDVVFSGDFLFKDSIGRWDFPYSNKNDMIKSLEKAMKLQGDFRILPGHGGETSLQRERQNFTSWLQYVKMH
ncbi:MBL fold metallo-hydrolase [Campylobacter suis]|uniref:Metallo-beta-lactamase domain-containing protein n=1 Tax=Campylobacter suis TaxID=2790657 RepID=A0ABM8Q1M4_9BACT|nr:MBL fold metallo-hydrolase [Campylobacter suis]CAD7286685.1 hypothetical protein LMG8286_00486 [Campylobacter suis]